MQSGRALLEFGTSLAGTGSGHDIIQGLGFRVWGLGFRV